MKRFGLILLSSLLIMLPSCQGGNESSVNPSLVSDTSRADDEVKQEFYAIYEKPRMPAIPEPMRNG